MKPENFPVRKPTRVPHGHYAGPGGYFVTLVTQQRMMLFGDVFDGQMHLNPAGEMAVRWWAELGCKFPQARAGIHIVMPNHLHGLIEIHPPAGEDGLDLPEIIQWYKTMTTNEYIHGVKLSGWTPFPGKLWQRSYHDHTVRNERSLAEIERYIIDNPIHWENDDENQLNP